MTYKIQTLDGRRYYLEFANEIDKFLKVFSTVYNHTIIFLFCISIRMIYHLVIGYVIKRWWHYLWMVLLLPSRDMKRSDMKMTTIKQYVKWYSGKTKSIITLSIPSNYKINIGWNFYIMLAQEFHIYECVNAGGTRLRFSLYVQQIIYPIWA